MAAADPALLVQRFFALVNRKSAGESLAFMHRSGLTMPQIVVLHTLRRGDASISELAARLRMSLPATSQLVEKLVGAELIARTEGEEDRRVRRVSLRPAGRRFLDRLNELRLEEIRDALGSVGAEARARLGAAIELVVATLERELDRDPPADPRTRRTP